MTPVLGSSEFAKFLELILVSFAVTIFGFCCIKYLFDWEYSIYCIQYSTLEQFRIILKRKAQINEEIYIVERRECGRIWGFCKYCALLSLPTHIKGNIYMAITKLDDFLQRQHKYSIIADIYNKLYRKTDATLDNFLDVFCDKILKSNCIYLKKYIQI